LKEGGVDDFHRKEDNFSMTQARLRSELRLQAGRAKYIDVISHNLESDQAIMRRNLEPWKIFEAMSPKELDEVRRDIEAVAPAGAACFLPPLFHSMCHFTPPPRSRRHAPAVLG
jgi:hypothetical protein